MSEATRTFVYSNLICSFDHFDVCISGLVRVKGEYMLCKALDVHRDTRYSLKPIAWNDECEEYLADYKVAYKHWLYKDGVRPFAYNNWPLGWFREKWRDRNPIVEAAATSESEVGDG